MLLPKAYETAFGVHRLKALRNRYVDTAFQFGLYSNVILVPIGIVLNILSFIIFYQIKTYKSATGLHLMCIAIADRPPLGRHTPGQTPPPPRSRWLLQSTVCILLECFLVHSVFYLYMVTSAGLSATLSDVHVHVLGRRGLCTAMSLPCTIGR